MSERDPRPALNCLRGLAALLVVVYHFRFYADFPILEYFPALAYGTLAVDFFFVLSGLIISHVYLAQFLAGRVTYREFLFLRVSRLFPVHLLVMVLMLAGTLAAGRALTAGDMIDWVTLSLLVRQLLLPEGYAWNSAAWSVSAEMFAYAAGFPAVVAAGRYAPGRFGGPALFALGWLLIWLLIERYGKINADSGAGPLIRVTAGFLIGAGLYRMLGRTARSGRADLALAAGLAFAVLAAVMLRSQVLVVAGATVAIVGAYLGTGPLTRLMGLRGPFYFGEISFSLYLVHLPVLKAGAFLAATFGFARGPLFCLAGLAVSLACAALLYELVEVPARRRMRGWWASGRRLPFRPAPAAEQAR